MRVNINCFLHSVADTGESSRFPDQTSVEESDYKYFISDFNFETVRGKLLIGARYI